jgi:hypothetical protein
MTSWLRGTAVSIVPRKCRNGALHLPPGPADFAAAPAIGSSGRLCCSSINALHAAHLDFFRRRLRCHIVVKHARFGFLDVLIQDNPDDDVLVTAKRTGDADAVAFAHGTMRLRVFGVDLHFAALTRALGFRTCLVETGDVEPDVESNALVHSDQDFNLRLRPQRVDEQLCLRVAVLLREELLNLRLGFVEWHDTRVLPIGHLDDVKTEL